MGLFAFGLTVGGISGLGSMNQKKNENYLKLLLFLALRNLKYFLTLQFERMNAKQILFYAINGVIIFLLHWYLHVIIADNTVVGIILAIYIFIYCIFQDPIEKFLGTD